MRNQPVEYKIENSLDVVKNCLQLNRPYYFSLEDKGSLIVTIYNPNKTIGLRKFCGHNYRLFKCLVHEKNYEEVDFNMNHELQLSEKIVFPLLISFLEINNLINNNEVTLEIIKINNYHYIINNINKDILRIQNIDLRLKNIEYRLQNIEVRIQNIEYRRSLYQEHTKLIPSLYQDLSYSCPNIVPCLSEEFIRDD